MEWTRAQAHYPRRAPTTAPARPATTITITDAGGCSRSEESGLKATILQESDTHPSTPGFSGPEMSYGIPIIAIPFLTMLPAEPVLLAIIGSGDGWGRRARARQQGRSEAGVSRREA